MAHPAASTQHDDDVNVSAKAKAIEHRRHGRLRNELLRSSIGPIIDVSASGIRVLCSSAPAGTVTVDITNENDASLQLEAKVIWTRRIGMRKHLAGLLFVDMTPELQASFARLRQGALPTTNSARSSADRRARSHSDGLIGLLTIATALGCEVAFRHALPHVPQLRLVSHPTLHVLAVCSAVGVGLYFVVRSLLGGSSRRGVVHLKAARRPLSGTAEGELLDSVLRSLHSAVFVMRAVHEGEGKLNDLIIERVNEAAEHLVGRAATDLVGMSVRDHETWLTDADIWSDAEAVFQSRLSRSGERFMHQSRRWYLLGVTRYVDGVVVNAVDITEKKHAEQEMMHAAYHDALTGLPNRKYLLQRLEQTIVRQQQGKGTHFAVLFLDFDGFKRINDTIGHEAGDQLLVNIAERLRTNLRSGDQPTSGFSEHMPARLGGDEFVVLLDRVATDDDAAAVAERLLTVFEEPHQIAGQEIVSRASIGVVSSQLGYTQADDILRDADTAMYAAKTSGKGRYVVFNESMHAQAERDIDLTRDIESAIDRGEVGVAFEPVVNLSSLELAAVEATPKWSHPDRGDIDVDTLQHTAEAATYEETFGLWFARSAIRQFARLRNDAQASADAERTLQLNLPLLPGQVSSDTLVPCLVDALAAADLRQDCLRLVIPESVITEAGDGIHALCDALRETDIQMIISNFGTGHAAFHYIRNVPACALKLDAYWTAGTDDAAAQGTGVMLNALVEFAHQLDLTTLAPHIDDIAQLHALRDAGCDYGQGAALGEPVTLDAARDLLTHDFASTAA